MIVYKTNGNMQFDVSEGEPSDSSYIKLKISTILPSTLDVDVFAGKADIKYPIVPCHMATAHVSEDVPEYGFKRGTKVILNPYVLSTINEEKLAEAKRYGFDEDGFLRDFVAMPADNIIPLPDDVKESEAIFTEQIAVALATLNAFNLEKGDYIAIVGDSVLTNIIAQLALYYQAIPILILQDERYIKVAEQCGMYYIVNATTEDPVQKVLSITGGRMANHTVLHAVQGASANFLFSLTRRSGDAVITGMSSVLPRLETDVCQIAKKQVSICGVSSAESEIISAVNILAQKQLNLQYFIDKIVDLEEAQLLFQEELENPGGYMAAIIKAL